MLAPVQERLTHRKSCAIVHVLGQEGARLLLQAGNRIGTSGVEDHQRVDSSPADVNPTGAIVATAARIRHP
jgi:hypothetical protein